MPRFYVGRHDCPKDEFIDCASDIEATNATRAAEVFVELHHADLDYPDEITIAVLPFGAKSRQAYRVRVVSVPEAIAERV